MCRSLGIHRDKLDKWAREGLPRKKIKNYWVYDEDQLVRWCVENGKAEPVDTPQIQEPEVVRYPSSDPQPIVCRRAELQQYFGVRLNTVAGWLREPDFPGRAGKAANHGRDGYFPIRDIAYWLIKTRATTSIPRGLIEGVEGPARKFHQRFFGNTESRRQTPQDRLTTTRATKAELELKLLQGTVVEVEQVRRMNLRIHGYACTIFRSFPTRLMSVFPSDLDATLKRAILECAKTVVDQTCESLSLLLEKDADESQHDDTADSEDAPGSGESVETQEGDTAK